MATAETKERVKLLVQSIVDGECQKASFNEGDNTFVVHSFDDNADEYTYILDGHVGVTLWIGNHYYGYGDGNDEHQSLATYAELREAGLISLVMDQDGDDTDTVESWDFCKELGDAALKLAEEEQKKFRDLVSDAIATDRMKAFRAKARYVKRLPRGFGNEVEVIVLQPDRKHETVAEVLARSDSRSEVVEITPDEAFGLLKEHHLNTTLLNQNDPFYSALRQQAGALRFIKFEDWNGQ